MKKITWDKAKAREFQTLLSRGGVTFEDCVIAIENDKILDVLPNPSPKYPHQQIFVLAIRGYAYVVPYVETETEIFLKTVFPSRKFNAIYLNEL